MKNNAAFFGAPGPGDRGSRREAIADYVGNIHEHCEQLLTKVREGDLDGARRAFEDIIGWLDAVGDNLGLLSAFPVRRNDAP